VRAALATAVELVLTSRQRQAKLSMRRLPGAMEHQNAVRPMHGPARTKQVEKCARTRRLRMPGKWRRVANALTMQAPGAEKRAAKQRLRRQSRKTDNRRSGSKVGRPE
jgi:hypothetical protein